MKICYGPIGTIHSGFKKRENIPIQSRFSDAKGYVELKKEYEAGLKDLEGFSHIILLYHFHRSEGYSMSVRPFLDDKLRGLFATRAPKRPNPIGLSVVTLESIEKNMVHINNVDILDGTPLLDIKPFVPDFQEQIDVKIGWLDGKIKGKGCSDSRFR